MAERVSFNADGLMGLMRFSGGWIVSTQSQVLDTLLDLVLCSFYVIIHN